MKFPGIEIRLSLRGKALELTDDIEREKLKKKDIVDSSTHKLLTIQEIIRGVIVDTTFNELPYDTAVHASNLIIDKKLIKINFLQLTQTIIFFVLI